MVIRMVIRMVSRMVIRMVSRMVILWLYGVLEGPHFRTTLYVQYKGFAIQYEACHSVREPE